MARERTILSAVLSAEGGTRGAAEWDRAADKVVRGGNKIVGSADRANTAMDSVRRYALRASVALGGAFGAIQFIRTVDELTLIENRMRLVTDSAEELQQVQQDLLKISQQTSTPLAANAELFARIALSTRDYGVSQREVLDLTKSLNQAIVLSGASSIEARNGLIQLSQGLASGALRGDELRAVLEQLPAVADVIAKSLGVTRGELREMGADGRITSEIILRAFKEAREELDQNFRTTSETTERAITRLRNSAARLAKDFDEVNDVTGTVAGSIDAVSNTMVFAANNGETLRNIVLSIGFGIAAGQAIAFAGSVNSVGVSAAFTSTRVGQLALNVRALGAAVRTTLGPIGILTTVVSIAALELIDFGNDARDAAPKVDQVTDSIVRLRKAADQLEFEAGLFGDSTSEAAKIRAQIDALQASLVFVRDSAESAQFPVETIRNTLYSDEGLSFLERVAGELQTLNSNKTIAVVSKDIEVLRSRLAEIQTAIRNDPIALLERDAAALSDRLSGSLNKELDRFREKMEEIREFAESEGLGPVGETPQDAVNRFLSGLSGADTPQTDRTDSLIQGMLNGVQEQIDQFNQESGPFLQNIETFQQQLSSLDFDNLDQEAEKLRAMIDTLDALQASAPSGLSADQFGPLTSVRKTIGEILAGIEEASKKADEEGEDAAQSWLDSFYETIQDGGDQQSLFDQFFQGIPEAGEYLTSLQREIDLIGASNGERQKAVRLAQAEAVAMQLNVGAREEFLRQANELIVAEQERQAEVTASELIDRINEEISVRELLAQGLAVEADLQRIVNQAKQTGVDLTQSQIDTIRERLVAQQEAINASREENDLAREREALEQRIAVEAGNALLAIADRSKSASEAAKDLIQSLIALAFRYTVVRNLANSFDFLGGNSTAGAPAGGAAKGAAFMGGGVVPMARGGLITQTAVMPLRNGRIAVAGEDGTEAALPLARAQNGDLAVRATGGGGSRVVNNITLSLPNVRSINKGFGETRRQAQRQLRGIVGGSTRNPGG